MIYDLVKGVLSLNKKNRFSISKVALSLVLIVSLFLSQLGVVALAAISGTESAIFEETDVNVTPEMISRGKETTDASESEKSFLSAEIADNSMYMIPNKTAAATGETVTASIGVNLASGIDIAALQIALDYDQSLLLIKAIQFPENLTSLNTGPFFAFTPKSVNPQLSGVVIILTFEILDDSKEATIALNVIDAYNSFDAEINLSTPDVVVINSAIYTAKVIGRVKSYNPNKPTTIALMKGEQVKYQKTIDETTSFGLVEQDFEIEGVAPGTYTLVINKAVHTQLTVKNIIVGYGDVDLKKDDRTEVQMMTLRCGDINDDNTINDGDLTILWMINNYNRRTTDGADSRCDLDGDGLINDKDLTILWLVWNYNKGEVIIE